MFVQTAKIQNYSRHFDRSREILKNNFFFLFFMREYHIFAVSIKLTSNF